MQVDSLPAEPPGKPQMSCQQRQLLKHTEMASQLVLTHSMTFLQTGCNVLLRDP